MKRFSLAFLLLVCTVIAAFFAGWVSRNATANKARLSQSFHFVLHSNNFPKATETDVYLLEMEALVDGERVHSWSEDIILMKTAESKAFELNGTSISSGTAIFSPLEVNELPGHVIAVDVTYSTEGYSLSGRIVIGADEMGTVDFGSYPARLSWSLVKKTETANFTND